MLKIPKEKLHFLFGLSPKLPPSPSGYNFCTSYEQVQKYKLTISINSTVLNNLSIHI